MQNIVRIQLVGTKQYLDVKEDTAFPLTYALADIRDLSKRTGSFSKTITLQGNKNNNKILNNYFDVNIVAGTFDINRRTLVDIIQNGVPIFTNATLQLVSVNKSQDNSNYEDKVTYSCLIKDTSGDLYSILNQRYLSDIPQLGFMNHRLNSGNVFLSFFNDYQDGYKYVPTYKQFGSIDVSGTPIYEITDFNPSIFAKTYMDYIFANAGYSYTWDEQFNTDVQFDKLLIPYNGGALNTTKVEDSAFFVDVSGGTQGNADTLLQDAHHYPGKHIWWTNFVDLTFPLEVTDPSGLFAGNRYTTANLPSATNDVSFEFEIDYSILAVNTTSQDKQLRAYDVTGQNTAQPNTYEPLLMHPRILIVSRGVSGTETPKTKGILDIAGVYGNALPTGDILTPGVQERLRLKLRTGALTIPMVGDGEQFEFKFVVTRQNQFDGAGRPIAFNFYNAGDTSNEYRTGAAYRFTINTIDMKVRTNLDGEYGYNINVDMNRMIPDKIKQSDFLKSICQMYNLYLTVNPDNPNNIIFKHRDKFYDTGVNKDWTTKLCKDKDQEIQFLPELHNKKLLLTYKQDDKDLDNCLPDYFSNTKEIFGQFEYTFDNEYVKDIDKQEVLFSPTMTRPIQPYGHIVPNWRPKTPEMNPRIVIDGGFNDQFLGGYTDLSNGQLIPNQGYYIRNFEDEPVSAMTHVSSIPFVSHIDNQTNPQFDINFGTADYYIPRPQGLTHNNLFNLYWRRTVNQINSGKMLTAFFNLNEQDIAQLKLNDKIRLDNSWWNINKIIDYNANSTQPTKVELISIDDNLNIAFSTRVPKEFTGEIPTLPRDTGIIGNQRNRNNILSREFNEIIGINNFIGESGKFNYVEGDRNIVSGDYNRIGGNNNDVEGTNSFIWGDFNTIPGNVDHAFVFGSYLTADTTNSALFSNIQVSGTINGTDSSAYITTAATIDINGVRQNLTNNIITEWRASMSNTGVLLFDNSGLTRSGTTQINIGSISAIITDNETNPNIPTYIRVFYSGATGMTVPTIGGGQVSYVYLQNPTTATTGTIAGTIGFQNTTPTSAQRKQRVYLGKIAHPNLATITYVISEPDFVLSPIAQQKDVLRAVSYINEGVYATARTGLTLNSLSSTIIGSGVNFVNDRATPNTLAVPAQSPLSFVYRTSTGGTTGFISTLDPTSYEVAGIITPIPGSINRATNQRLFFVPGAGFLIQYGQIFYNTIAEAQAAIPNENFTIWSILPKNSILINVFTIRKGATDVLNPLDFLNVRADIFGQTAAGSGGGGGGGTLQQAYDISSQPQITVVGAMQFKGTTNVGGTPVVQIINSAGTETIRLGELGGITATTYNNHSFLLNTVNSNFIGTGAGGGASTVPQANWIGFNAGLGATSASQAIFIGSDAGRSAVNAAFSNFQGSNAGNGATNAHRSFFVGNDAGRGATNAAYSIALGFQAASGSTMGSGNTIIGMNVSLPSGSTNSFNLGGVLFAGGMYGNPTGSPLTTSVTSGGFVGINISGNSAGTLDVRQGLGGGGTYTQRWFNSAGVLYAQVRELGFECASYNSFGASSTVVNGNQSLFLYYNNSTNGGLTLGNGGGGITGAIMVPVAGQNRSLNNVNTSIYPGVGSSANTYNTFAIQPFVNMTGSTNTLTRGLYINPVLSGITGTNRWIAFEITNGGTILQQVTATTISANTYVNIPFWASGTGNNSVIQKGTANQATNSFSLATGVNSIASGLASFTNGSNTTAQGTASEAGGQFNTAQYTGEWSRSGVDNTDAQYGVLDYIGQAMTTTAQTEIFIAGQLAHRLQVNQFDNFRLKCEVLLCVSGLTKEFTNTITVNNNSGGVSTVFQTGFISATGSPALSGYTGANIGALADTNLIRFVVNNPSTSPTTWYMTVHYIKVIA